MEILNLSELAAPLEKLRPDVIDAYERIDERWSEVADILAKLTLPCKISVVVECHDPQHRDWKTLEWRKHKGTKKLCLTDYCEIIQGDGELYVSETVTPYEEWSATKRLETLAYVPKLFSNGIEQVQIFIAKAKGETE